jgi:hypothetical protein
VKQGCGGVTSAVSKRWVRRGERVGGGGRDVLRANSASRDIRDMYQPYICFVHNQDEKRDGRMFCFLCDFLSSFMINAEALKGASN